MGEPGALEVVDRRRVDAVVLAEHEAAQERRLRVSGVPLPRAASARSGRRSITREAAAAPARRLRCGPAAEHLADAESRQVARLPGPRLREHPARRAPAGRSEGPGPARGLDRQAARRRSDPHGHLAVRPVRNRGHIAASPSRRDRSARRRRRRRSPQSRSAPTARPAVAAARATRASQRPARCSRTPRDGRAAPPRDIAAAQERRCTACCRRGVHRQDGERRNAAATRSRARDRGQHRRERERCRSRHASPRRSGLEPGAERLHGRRADAVDLVELVDRGEPPCWSRKSTMFCAVTGPIPSIVSSSSTVAVPRLIGPRLASAARADARGAPVPGPWRTTTCWPSASRAARLIASTRARRRAARALDRVVDPRAGRQPVDARVGTAPATSTTTSRVALAASTASESAGEAHRPSAGGAAWPARADPARADQQQRDRDGAVDEQLGAARARARARVWRARAVTRARRQRFVHGSVTPRDGARASGPRKPAGPRAPRPDLDALDHRAARALARRSATIASTASRLALEDRLDGAVRACCGPTRRRPRTSAVRRVVSRKKTPWTRRA